MKKSLFLLALLWALPVSAQPRPVVATTVTTTDTTADSLLVGCVVGTTTCTGGIKAGPVDVSLITSGGAIGIASNVPIVATMKLYNNAGTLTWNGSPLSVGGSTVSGTIGKLAKFTGAAAVGDSICSESGTTITCVNTVSATTLTGTLSTVSQPNVTTMAGLTSAATLATIGTITSGTWQGTIIDLTRGGAGVSLAATGGTSQFLRQNGVGSTITVVRPAVSDLSDSANVALLNAANSWDAGVATIQIWRTSGTLRGYTGIDNGGSYIAGSPAGTMFWRTEGAPMMWSTASGVQNMTLSSSAVLTVSGAGAHTFSGAVVGQNTINVVNTNSSTTSLSALYLGTDASTTQGRLLAFSTGYASGGAYQALSTVLEGNQSGGLSITASHASGVTRFYTGAGVLRWGINAAGDWLFGASSHIADSSGTPTCNGSDCSSVSGTDYAFKVTGSGSNHTSMNVNFGHTFSTAPICVATNASGFGIATEFRIVTSASLFTIAYAANVASENINVLCRSY